MLKSVHSLSKNLHVGAVRRWTSKSGRAFHEQITVWEPGIRIAISLKRNARALRIPRMLQGNEVFFLMGLRLYFFGLSMSFPGDVST